MPHLLSTKLDATLHYASGLYGVATAVLTDIANALSAAGTAQGDADAAQVAADAAAADAATALAAATTPDTLEIAKAGTLVGTRKRLNLIEGSGATLTVTDNAGAESVDVTVTATGGGGGGVAAHAATHAPGGTDPLTTATPVTVGTTNAEGASTAFSRADHVHAHGDLAGGTLHADAIAGGASGFLSGAGATKIASLAAGQAATVGVLTVDAILETPTAVTYASSVNCDTSVKNDFTIGALTGPITINLTNPANGRQGFVAVRQDATGSRTVTLAVSGYTNYRDSGTTDLAAASAANAITVYAYALIVVGGVNMALWSKLTPVTP